MSKRTFLLILGLLAITVVLVLIAISPKKTEITSTVNDIPNKIQEIKSIDNAQTTLSFSPNPLTATTSPSSLDVLIDTGNNETTGVQLELGYDPKIIEIIDIKPASFYPGALVLYKKIDTANKKVLLTLGVSSSANAKKGNGTVTTITFNVLDKTKNQTEITFLTDTIVTAIGADKSVLKTSTPATIITSQ